MESEKKKRGGPQPGSGRPSKALKQTTVKIYAPLFDAWHKAAGAKRGEKTAILERALARELGLPWPPATD